MMMDKSLWRERIRARRDSLTEEERVFLSKKLCDRVANELLLPLEAKRDRPLTLCAYGAFRSEASPEPLFAWCSERGHRTVAPRVLTGTVTGLELRTIGSDRDWKLGRWGVPEPDPDRCEKLGENETVDVVLVPGLVFDRLGGRLGYGGGYYDRLYEARNGAGHRSLWIGFAYGLQVVDEELPKESHDLRMDGLITENEWIRLNREP